MILHAIFFYLFAGITVASIGGQVAHLRSLWNENHTKFERLLEITGIIAGGVFSREK